MSVYFGKTSVAVVEEKGLQGVQAEGRGHLEVGWAGTECVSESKPPDLPTSPSAGAGRCVFSGPCPITRAGRGHPTTGVGFAE